MARCKHAVDMPKGSRGMEYAPVLLRLPSDGANNRPLKSAGLCRNSGLFNVEGSSGKFTWRHEDGTGNAVAATMLRFIESVVC